MTRRIVIIQPYVPDYRVVAFERVRAALLDRGFDLQLVTARPRGAQAARGDRAHVAFESTVPSFEVRLRDRAVRFKAVWKHARGADLVISELASGALENYVLTFRARRRHAMWGHGFQATSRPSRLDSVLEHWLARRAVRIFAYTSRGRDELVAAGVGSDRITVLDNTVDTSPLRAAIADVSDDDVAAFRQRLLLGDGPCCAYIGGLDRSKRIDFLLLAAERLAAELPGFRLLVAGDGVLRRAVERKARSAPWLRYIGRVGAREKALIARTADLLLNPGRVGLVAVESFTMRVPIVTTTYRGHAPEFAYLVDGVNAIVTPDTLGAYVDAVRTVLADAARLEVLKSGCAASAPAVTIDGMVERFADGIARAADSVQIGPALFVWGKWGPYHLARLRAARELFATRGVVAEGLELFSQSGIYGWATVGDESVTSLAFPPPETAFRPWLLTTRAVPFLLRTRPSVVFVPSYWPWSLFVNLVARLQGARIVMMSETHAATARPGKLRGRIRATVVRRFDAALVGGTPHADYFESLGLDAGSIFVGYDVVDNVSLARTAELARESAADVRQTYGLPPRYILSLGRLVAKKNLSTLVAAYAEYAATVDVPEAMPALVIVGDGPCLSELQRQVAQLGYGAEEESRPGRSGAVLFRPSVAADEVAGLYALADMVVLASTSEEWGLTVNEAMACGVPVLVSRVAGCATDLVGVGGGGLLFDPSSTKQLSELLRRVVEEPQLRAAMAVAASQAISEWGPERFARAAASAAGL